MAGRMYNKVMSLSDVHAWFVHTLRDAGDSNVQNATDVTRYFGFLREDFAPKPAYCVFVTRSSNTYTGC
jgi:hypothetical protein